ncbi:RNA-binding protein [Pedobacter nototheniae]|uniref:RNA recognition motif domain-containing protein n=1 Tax=Pedobacter nototheniae TaxID=2488994 RepID=UPI00293000F7|nr:RNA-binding protein [Pedobacter nototheniae]
MTKLFIGGLPDNIQEMDLAIHVSIHGQIDTIKVVRDRATGRCKGFAFLEIVDLAAANNIIDNLNGETFRGNTITVKICEELPPKNPVYKKVMDPSKKKRARL